MRTIRTKVYSFDELNEAAQEKAIQYFRNQGMDTTFIYDDAVKTVEAFHEAFGTKEDSRTWLEVYTGHIDDNILQLKGLRLQKYIWNNFKNILYKGKYYNYKGNTPNKLIHKRIESIFYPNRNYWGNYYYSAITKENSCTLTGVCYDHSLLQPIYDFLENYRGKADYYSYMDYETLLNDCFESLKKDVENEAEAQSSDEVIREHIQANEHEFTADGKLF